LKKKDFFYNFAVKYVYLKIASFFSKLLDFVLFSQKNFSLTKKPIKQKTSR